MKSMSEFDMAPSSFGKHSGKHSWPATVDQFGIKFHRPTPQHCGIHGSLMDKNLAQFMDDLNYGEVTRADYEFTPKVLFDHVQCLPRRR